MLGKLQSEFEKSANTFMDNAQILKAVDAKVSSFKVPQDFEGNSTEFHRRSKEGLQRLLGNEYMLAIQNKKRFDLQETLRQIPNTETPTTLNERAATIENRVMTAGEKIDPDRRLRNATIDTQQTFLESAANALREEKIKTGTIAADGAIKEYAQNSYKAGLLPADVANYAALTEGVAIPQATINSLAATPKPELEKKPVSPAPAAAVAASAPAVP
ncbi:MAG: hypothetical protein A3J37_05780 [Alphaproteobacteria bacterium RIFCSPHIGHO2_12_FULL_45_9]|nr:MAG: hypothetical protein A3B66_04950 [Alphaproteobacteria bacterium RIFCSPHIGHO2_02_FULL_46_13]OFW94910.1 MAG: hypothetical protein A3J37_05780 [Alphaproteobacteria bacterium RIFCSPHIGHO2_12_FULL_45_9]